MTYPQLSPAWNQEIGSRLAKANDQGFKVIDPQTSLLVKTFGILLLPSQSVQSEIIHQLNQDIPASVIPKIFLQPHLGYHISLQWSPEFLTPSNMPEYTKKIKNLFKNIHPLSIQIHLTYLTDVNLTAIVEIPDLDLLSLRADINKIFEEFGLTPKLPLISTAWISLAKFTNSLEKTDIDALLALPKKTITTTLDQIAVTHNDPFNTPGISQTLFSFRLT